MVSNQNRIRQLELELLHTKEALKESELKLSILLENMPGGVFSYDADTGKFDYVSQGCLDIFHCSKETFMKEFFGTFDLMVAKIDRERVKEQIADQLKFFDSVELTYRTRDLMAEFSEQPDTKPEPYIWIYHRSRLVKTAEGKRLFYVVISDITDEKLVQNHLQLTTESLRQKAETDALTGLYNRASMELCINETIASSAAGACHALLIVDTDNFKSVNDSFGHQYGDKIIVFVADSIRKIFRETDFVGRLGGDEFIIFMKNTSLPITKNRAALLNDAIRTTLSENGITVNISCSIGIAFYNTNGTSYKTLYSAADNALYKAKELGKNQYQISND